MATVPQSVDRLHDLSNSGDPLGEADITEFESEIGAKLPADYREFLLLRNGGDLEFHKTYGDAYVTKLYGLIPDADYMDLRWNLDCFADRIPKEYLPIGDGGGAVFLCMCLETDRYGWLYEWDRSEEMTTPFDRMSYLVSKSFRELLSGLEPSEDERENQEETAARVPEPFRSIVRYDMQALRDYLAKGRNVDKPLSRRISNVAWMSGNTPLMVTACTWPAAARILLEYGANVHFKDHLGRTALNHAARIGSIDGVKLLLDAGADPLEMDSEGENALRAAMSHPYSRTLTLIKSHLQRQGTEIDYDKVERDAQRARLIRRLLRDSLEKRGKSKEVFFSYDDAGMGIDDSGFMLVCYQRPSDEHVSGLRVPSLNRLVELIPLPKGNADSLPPMARVRYEFCARVLGSVGERIVPSNRSITIGQMADCIRELYQPVKKRTERFKKAQAAINALTPEFEERLEARLYDALERLWIKEASAGQRKMFSWTKLDPSTVNIRSPKEFASILIPKSGFHMSVSPERSRREKRLRLDLLVNLSPRIAYAVDATELDANLSHPVTYARYEVCKSIYEPVAKSVSVSRKGVKLAQVAECVNNMYTVILELTSGSETVEDVAGKLTAEVRKRLAKELRSSLRRVCTKTS